MIRSEGPIPSNSNGSHTPGHIACPACEQAKQVHSGGLSPEMTFRDAFKIWITMQVIEEPGTSTTSVRFMGKRTEADLRMHARYAGRFFDSLRLSDIHAGHFREFQRARALNSLKIGAE